MLYLTRLSTKMAYRQARLSSVGSAKVVAWRSRLAFLSLKHSYPQSALAGIVSISGWCTDRDGLASAVSTAQQGRTRLFFSCGTGDPIVEFKLTKLSSELLTATLGDHVVVRHPTARWASAEACSEAGSRSVYTRLLAAFMIVVQTKIA